MWFFRKKRRTFVVRIQGGTPGTGQRRCHGKNKVQGPDVTPQCGNPPLFHMLFQFSKGWCPWSNSSTFAGGKTPEFAEFFSGSSFGFKVGAPPKSMSHESSLGTTFPKSAVFLDLKCFSDIYILGWWFLYTLPYSSWHEHRFTNRKFDVRVGSVSLDLKIRPAMGHNGRRMSISSSQAGKLRSTSCAEIHKVLAMPGPMPQLLLLWLFDDALQYR